MDYNECVTIKRPEAGEKRMISGVAIPLGEWVELPGVSGNYMSVVEELPVKSDRRMHVTIDRPEPGKPCIVNVIVHTDEETPEWELVESGVYPFPHVIVRGPFTPAPNQKVRITLAVADD
jgi:hypothetical protein